MDMIVHKIVAKAGWQVFPVFLKYYRTDPLAVTLVFRDSEDENLWQVSRDLLFDGMFRKTGEGDFQLQPVDSRTMGVWMFGMREDDRVEIPIQSMRTFLRETEEVVPRGEEELIVKDGLDDWLKENVD